MVEVFGRDADPGILDRDAQLVPRGGFAQTHDPHQDMALGGELDRVAHQVRQDLAHPHRVGLIPRRQEQVEIGQQANALFPRLRFQKQHHLVDAAFQIKGFGVQPQLFRPRLGIVEHLVDQGQKRLARGADRFDEQPLFVRKRGVREQLGHADHPVQGGADFMAHVGQKGRLGAVCRIGAIARLLQVLFALHLFGDVLHQRHEIAVRGLAFAEPQPLPRGQAHHARARRIGRDLLLDPGDPVVGAAPLEIDKVVVDDAAQHLVHRHAGGDPAGCVEQGLEIAVRHHQPFLRIIQREAVAHRVQRVQ